MNLNSPNKNNGVSVIVCCYNSSKRLPETLKHLSQQNIPAHIEWEIILVDNNSTDNTKEVACNVWRSYKKNISFKIINESQQGLTHAREAGIKEAQFEYLIFCDDDNRLEENYIRYAFCIMKENDKIGVLGGSSEAVFETEKPLWFERFQAAYAVGKPMKHSGIANARTYLAGAGMILRRSAVELMQRFSFKQLLIDRKGRELTSGGDVELCLITMFLGYDLYFDERLKFIHFIPAERLSWKYCVDMMSCGHAIPQIYFHLYFNYYHKIINGKEARFADGYRNITVTLLKNMARNFFYPKHAWTSFKCLVKTQEGSKKEIEIKATINKLKYLFKNKAELKSQFDMVKQFLFRVKDYRVDEM